MPRYLYSCENCGMIERDHIPVDERDSQQCQCGQKLKRELAFATVAIEVPPWMTAAAVHMQMPNQSMPKSAKAKKHWDERDMQLDKSL